MATTPNTLRDVARAFMKHKALQGPKPDGPTIHIHKGASPCVIPLLAFARQSATLPDDFTVDIERLKAEAPAGQALGTTLSKWLQAHVRGDGAVYQATFDVPYEKGGALVVFGSPTMTEPEAKRASLAYRRLLAMTQDGENAAASQRGSGHASPASTQDGDLTS